jgi:hypothetical protein
MKPPSDDAAILTSAKYVVYGLLGSSAVLKVVSTVLGWLGGAGRGQVSSDAQARSASRSLSHLSGALAASAVSIVLLAIAYWASSLIRPVGLSLDDGHKGAGVVRFAVEVGGIVGAGVLSLVMCDNSGHRLIGLTAVGAALAYSVFRAVEFFGSARLGRLRESLRLGGLRVKKAGVGPDSGSKSCANHTHECQASQQGQAQARRARGAHCADPEPGLRRRR